MSDERIKGLVEGADDIAFLKAVLTKSVEEKIKELKEELILELQKIVKKEVEKASPETTKTQIIRIEPAPTSEPIINLPAWGLDEWYRFNGWTTVSDYNRAKKIWVACGGR